MPGFGHLLYSSPGFGNTDNKTCTPILKKPVDHRSGYSSPQASMSDSKWR